MNRTPLALAIGSLALFGCATLAAADTVHLKGGDRLSGTIVTKDAKKITLKTAYAKEPIELLWSEVTSIETDTTARFMLHDRTLMNAQATPAGPNRLPTR